MSPEATLSIVLLSSWLAVALCAVVEAIYRKRRERSNRRTDRVLRRIYLLARDMK